MSALTAYMDAVVDALMDVGLGVRDHECDETDPCISIDLDPVSAVRQPALAWTPHAGWRVSMRCRGIVRRPTVRWLAAGPVPYPTTVAEAVHAWLADLDALDGSPPPVYDTLPSLLDAALAEAARAPR